VITPAACSPEHPDQTFSVELDVTNTGNYAGGEAVQLYVGMPSTDDVPQPPEQLKRFQKVHLNPGEMAHVQFLLDARSFSYWDVTSHGWVVAPGTYQIVIGSSSRDIRLQGQIPM
jgi:beta-glucosidase